MNTYKSLTTSLSTTGITSLYSVSTGTTSIIKSLYVGNINDGTSSAISVIISKTGSTDTYLIKKALVPIQSALQPITEPIILEQNDSLKVKAENADYLDIFLSYLEIT